MATDDAGVAPGLIAADAPRVDRVTTEGPAPTSNRAAVRDQDTSAGRVQSLDGMRAVFIGIVMAHHIVWALPGYADNWVRGTWSALDGFFVLSGFLIGGLVFGELERTGNVRYPRFVLRRFLRLYPALAIATAAMVFVSLRVEGGTWSALWPTVRASALYAMNWPFGSNQPVLIEYTHFWSLAVEFHFYLALPLLLWPLAKARVPDWAKVAVIVTVMGAIWWERTRVWTGPASFPAAYVFTWTRADTLLWGVLVALAIRRGWIGDRHKLILRALAVPVLAWQVWAIWRYDARTDVYTWKMTLSGLTNSLLLCWVLIDARSVVARLLASRPMAWLGTRSYSMYLYHFPVYFYAGRHLHGLTDRERLVTVLALVMVVSDLSYRLVERPAFRLKDRLAPRRSPLPVRAPASAATVE